MGAHDETPDVRKSTLADAKHQIMMSLYDYKRNYNQDVFGRDHLYEKSTGNICEGGTFNKLMSSLWGIHCDIVIEYITLAAFSEKFPIVVMEELNDYLQNLYQEATTAETEAQFFALLNTIKQGVTKQLWDETLNSKVSERLFSEFGVLFKDRNDIKFTSELSAYEDVDVSRLKWDLFKRKFTEEEKYPNPTMPVQLPPLVGNLQLESKEWNRTNSLIEQLKIETNLKTLMEDYQDIKLLFENLRKVDERTKDNNPTVRLAKELCDSLRTIWARASEFTPSAQNHTKDEVARMRKIVKDTNHITSLILSPASRPPRKECEKLLKDYRRNVESLPKNSFLWAQVWGAALMLVGIASIAMGIVCMATGLGIGGGVFCIAIGLAEYGCGHRMFKSGRGIGLRESVEDFADGAKKVICKK